MLSLGLAAQAAMLLAIACDVVAFQLHGRRRLLLCMSGGMALVCLHFALLAQWTAAQTMLLAVVRNFASLRRRTLGVELGFALLIVAGAVLTWGGLASLLASTGALLANRAMFAASERALRGLQLTATLVWIAHNLAVGSPLAVLREALVFASNLIGSWRLARRRPQSSAGAR